MSWLTTPNVVALPDDQTSPTSNEMSGNINAPIVSYIYHCCILPTQMLPMNVPLPGLDHINVGVMARQVTQPKRLVTWLARPVAGTATSGTHTLYHHIYMHLSLSTRISFRFLIDHYFRGSCCQAFIAEMVLED